MSADVTYKYLSRLWTLHPASLVTAVAVFSAETCPRPYDHQTPSDALLPCISVSPINVDSVALSARL